MMKYSFLKIDPRNHLWLFAFLILVSGSCKSDYQKYVDQEMAKGVTQDSLIFGMYMGQTKKDFYSICWDLNAKQILQQGSGNQYARYVEPNDSLDDTTLRKQTDFFGIFDSLDVMRGMDMIVHYTAWSTWNKERQAPALVEDLKEEILQRYGGNEFIPIDLKKVDFDAFVKIDGNRRILIYPLGSKDVAVKFEDLNYIFENL